MQTVEWMGAARIMRARASECVVANERPCAFVEPNSVKARVLILTLNAVVKSITFAVFCNPSE